MRSEDWKKKYILGVRIIDEEHKMLLSLIEQLRTRSLENEGCFSVGVVISALDSYVSTHFIVEEEFMQVYGYSDFSKHKESHEQFRSKIDQFKKYLDEDIQLGLSSIINYLESWLTHHIQKDDRKLAQYLISQGVT